MISPNGECVSSHSWIFCKPLHLFWLSFSSSSSLTISSSFSLQNLIAKKNNRHLFPPPCAWGLGKGLVGQFQLAVTQELQSHAHCNSLEDFTGTGGLTYNVLTHVVGMLTSASQFHFVYTSSPVILECFCNMAAGFP